MISPGRTATTSLSQVLGDIEGFTSAHESRCNFLGCDRIDYPAYHIECDNRLVWFLPRLTKKYCNDSILVIIKRDREAIANSYFKRFFKINIMTAYSQGILMRDFKDNDLEVCFDYVDNVYEHLDYFATNWQHVIYLDISSPQEGLKELLTKIKRIDQYEMLISSLEEIKTNTNKFGIRSRINWIFFSFRFLLENIKCAFR